MEASLTVKIALQQLFVKEAGMVNRSRQFTIWVVRMHATEPLQRIAELSLPFAVGCPVPRESDLAQPKRISSNENLSQIVILYHHLLIENLKERVSTHRESTLVLLEVWRDRNHCVYRFLVFKNDPCEETAQVPLAMRARIRCKLGSAAGAPAAASGESRTPRRPRIF